ncbi:MAG: hypothetical protein WCF85_11200 [Rhodospirillaceae bacterium]
MKLIDTIKKFKIQVIVATLVVAAGLGCYQFYYKPYFELSRLSKQLYNDYDAAEILEASENNVFRFNALYLDKVFKGYGSFKKETNTFFKNKVFDSTAYDIVCMNDNNNPTEPDFRYIGNYYIIKGIIIEKVFTDKAIYLRECQLVPAMKLKVW